MPARLEAGHHPLVADTTLAPDLGVEPASTDDVYAAMDWLGRRQEGIEAGLARRHLAPGLMVLYTLSSSWMEGSHCPLAARGYSLDHKGGKAQIAHSGESVSPSPSFGGFSDH